MRAFRTVLGTKGSAAERAVILRDAGRSAVPAAAVAPKTLGDRSAGPKQRDARVFVFARSHSGANCGGTASGGFKSLDDLKKVPGLDTRLVDSNKRRAEFSVLLPRGNPQRS
jgi:hypothetical protein